MLTEIVYNFCFVRTITLILFVAYRLFIKHFISVKLQFFRPRVYERRGSDVASDSQPMSPEHSNRGNSNSLFLNLGESSRDQQSVKCDLRVLPKFLLDDVYLHTFRNRLTHSSKILWNMIHETTNDNNYM